MSEPLGLPAWTWALALAALAAVAALGIAVGADNALTRWDAETVRAVAATRTPATVSVAKAVTLLGSVVVLVPLAVAAAITASRRITARRAFVPAIALLVAAVADPLAKAAIGRPRPPAELAEVVQHASGFPSGHSAQAAAFFIAAALIYDGRRRVAISAAAALVVLVGVSRVILGVHSPTDVLGGWLLGLGCALLVAGASQAAESRRRAA